MKAHCCIAVLVLALGSLAACGGGIDDDEAAYIQHLSELREETDAMTEQLNAGLQTATTPADVRRILAPISETSSSVVDELEALEPPEGLEEIHDLALDVNRSQAAAAGDVITAIDSGDRQASLDAYDKFIALQLEVRQDYRALKERISVESP